MTIVLGEDEAGGSLELEGDALKAAVHVLGVQGMGKSVCLGNIALQANQSDGVILLDIKDGAISREVAARADPSKLLYFEPGALFERHGRTIGLNPLEGDPETVVETVLDLFEMIGAADMSWMTRVRKFVRLTLSLCVAQPRQMTLQDARDALTDPGIRSRMLSQARPMPKAITDAWAEFERQNARDKSGVIESTLSRLDDLLIPKTLAAMLTAPQSTLNLASELEAGKLIIFNLVDGMPHHRQTFLMANLIMAMIVNAALTRVVAPQSRVWRVIADEADLLAPDAFVTSADKLRASRIFSVFSNQNLSQLANHKLVSSLTSSPIKIYFRISPKDINAVSDIVGGRPRAVALSKIPKHTAWVQVMDEEEPNPMWAHLMPEQKQWSETAMADWSEPLTAEELAQRLTVIREAQLASPHTAPIAKLDRIEEHGTRPQTKPQQPPAQIRPAVDDAPLPDRTIGGDSAPDRPSFLRFK